MSEKNKLQELCQKRKWEIPMYDSVKNPDCPPHQPEWNATVTIMANGKKIIIDTIVPTTSKKSAEKQAAELMLAHLKSTLSNKKSMLQKLSDSTKIHITSTHQRFINNSVTEPAESVPDFIGSSAEVKTISENIFEPFESVPINFTNSDTLSSSENINVNCIYLIDLENSPCFKHGYRNDSIYIGFINSIHHSIDKYDEWHLCESDNIEKELFHSSNHKLLYAVEGGTADLADHFMTLFIYPLVDYLKKICYNQKICIISGDHAGWCTRTCLEKVLKWHNLSGIEIINRGKL